MLQALHIEPIAFPRVKRIFDIVVSFIALIAISPIIALIMLIMCLEMLISKRSRGSIFYREIRVSEGKPFTLIKFRIFTTSAIEKGRNGNGVVHTKKLEVEHKNLTFIGSLLKKVYMDELPQLWNVLKGDMSLVGPRPTNMENSERLLKEGKLSKFLIKAGLTGFFQSHKGIQLNGKQEEMDMAYINFVKNNPGWKIVLYDIKILSITLRTILRAEGI